MKIECASFGATCKEHMSKLMEFLLDDQNRGFVLAAILGVLFLFLSVILGLIFFKKQYSKTHPKALNIVRRYPVDQRNILLEVDWRQTCYLLLLSPSGGMVVDSKPQDELKNDPKETKNDDNSQEKIAP